MAETMKDSGQEWIGAIPESWDTNRIRYCLNEINVKNSPVKTEQILTTFCDYAGRTSAARDCSQNG